MSLDFKLRYDQLREGDPTKPEAAATTDKESTFYNEPSNARNLCLIWPDGRRQFLNYAYLVGGTFIPGGEVNEITLNFSTYLVKLKGYNLESLFISLLNQLPKQIIQVEPRYVVREESNVAEMTAHLI